MKIRLVGLVVGVALTVAVALQVGVAVAETEVVEEAQAVVSMAMAESADGVSGVDTLGAAAAMEAPMEGVVVAVDKVSWVQQRVMLPAGGERYTSTTAVVETTKATRASRNHNSHGYTLPVPAPEPVQYGTWTGTVSTSVHKKI